MGRIIFIYHHDADIAYLLLYVDDIVLTTSSTTQLRSIVVQRGVFHDRSRALNYFLGIFVTHSPQGLFLFQQKYASKILEHAYMLQCNPTRTPVETTHKLDCSSPPILDRSFYCSFVVPFDILSLLSCILPLLARALPLRFNKYISLCMTHESLTSIHLSIF